MTSNVLIQHKDAVSFCVACVLLLLAMDIHTLPEYCSTEVYIQAGTHAEQIHDSIPGDSGGYIMSDL